GRKGQLGYQCLVHPGADPSRIRLAYQGATALMNGPTGGLTVSTPAGSFREAAPVAYQSNGGHRVPVQTGFSLAGARRPLSYSFRVASYDTSVPLIIDPTVIVFAGYIGGSADDEGLGVAVDPAGYVYISGQTASAQDTFPVKVG